MSYPLSFSLSFGSGRAGILSDLRAQLIDTTGSNVGGVISSGFIEVGTGNYAFLASIPTSHRGGLTFYRNSNNEILAYASINPEDDEFASTINALNGSEIEIVGPVLKGGATVIVAGDAYLASDNRALIYTPASDSTWPNLTGATVLWLASSLSIPATIINPAGPNKRLSVNLTALNTTSLMPPTNHPTVSYRLQIRATLADLTPATLMLHNLTVYTPVV